MIHSNIQVVVFLAVLSCGFHTCGRCAHGERPAVPYRVGHEQPLEVKEKVVAEADDHKQFRVEFNGIKGDRIPAYLYLPKGAKHPLPAVLLQYGTGGSKTSSYVVELGKLFVASGIAVLTIDSPMRGERREPGKSDTLFNQFNRKRFAHYCSDYSRAVDYLASRSDVDVNRVGYVGISWGAVTGVTFVAHDARIKAMTSIVGGGGFANMLTAREADGTNQARASLDPVDNVAQIAPRPLKMINVTRDWLMLRPLSEALHKAAGKNSAVVWLDTDHYFNGLDRRQVMQDEVVVFMKDKLQSKSQATRSVMME
jgi:uncharacterized protein